MGEVISCNCQSETNQALHNLDTYGEEDEEKYTKRTIDDPFLSPRRPQLSL